MNADATTFYLPRYWMQETTGVLKPAVEAYLCDAPMSEEHIAAMRAYLRQWICAPSWQGDEELTALRISIDRLTTRDAIDDWIGLAIELGVDPL